jgi:vitamin B12 transporter
VRKSLILLTTLLTATTAFAEEVPEIQVTATRVEVPVEHVGDDVEIITEEEIKKYGFTSIADVIKYVAGIHVSSNGGTGQQTSLYMLGLPTKHVLVMIDGVPIYDPTRIGGEANLEYIDLSNVERIEVLKGAQGALYGSDAIAGVINIITRKPKKTSFRIGLEGGKYNTFVERLYSGIKEKNGFISLNFENFKTEGFSATNEKSFRYEADNDGYNYRTGWLSFGWSPSDSMKVTGNIRLKKGIVEFDSLPYTPEAETDYYGLLANLRIDTIVNEQLAISTYLGSNKEDREYSFSNYTGNLRYFSLQPVYYFNERLFVTCGINYRQEKAEIPERHGANLKSVFTEVYGEYFGINGNLAIRRDFHSVFGNKTTYKVSASYKVKQTGTTLKGQYGTGFKAPSLFQLFYQYGGNENLKPENSEGWILGIRQEIPQFSFLKGTFELNYFKNRLWDMIDWYSGTYRNVYKAITEGAELKFNVNVKGWLDLYGTYTHLHTSENLRARRPEFSYTFGLNTYYKKVNFSAWVLHYADREDSNGKTLPGFTTFNCYASYQLSNRVNFYLKGINLTDKDYELAYGYNTMGRALFAGVEVSFK